METNPRVVFERLLGDGSTPAERAARQRQLSSLLDSVTGQVAALQRDLPGPDRERMDRYLTDVRELERRLSLAADSPLAELEVPDKPNGIPGDFEEHAMLMFDLLALAWAGDLTRIATFMVSRELSNRLYPRSGVNEGFHNASHHSGIPANIERLAKLNEYHTRVRRSRISCASWPTHPTATAACSITRLSFTAAAWRIRISTITTRCRCCSRAAVPAGSRADATSTRPRARRSPTCS